MNRRNFLKLIAAIAPAIKLGSVAASQSQLALGGTVPEAMINDGVYLSVEGQYAYLGDHYTFGSVQHFTDGGPVKADMLGLFTDNPVADSSIGEQLDFYIKQGDRLTSVSGSMSFANEATENRGHLTANGYWQRFGCDRYDLLHTEDGQIVEKQSSENLKNRSRSGEAGYKYYTLEYQDDSGRQVSTLDGKVKKYKHRHDAEQGAKHHSLKAMKVCLPFERYSRTYPFH